MKFKCASLLLVFSLVTACSQDIAATSIPVTPSVIPINTLTPSPTITPFPTSTQFPPLSGKPPYLLLKQDYYAQELMIYDHDGSGRRIFELPKDGHIIGISSYLNKIVSPDGKWLVFYTGSVDGGEYNDDLPVTLKLLNITDGTVRMIAEVVTEGYQKKLEEVADSLKKLDPKHYQPIEDVNWVFGSTVMDFQYGIYSVVWSPDSKHLAFAGQIDGISSDVYLYDVELNTIQQITDDVQNVSGLRWSPDGNYIVLYNSIPGYVYPGTSLHFLKPSDQAVKMPKSLWGNLWGGIVDWLSPNLLLMTGGTDTAGSTDLQALSVATGQVWSFWKGLYGEVAIDHANNIIAMTTSDYTPPENPGIYFVDFNGNKKLVQDGYYYHLVFRGGEKHRFLALKYSLKDGNNLVAITLDGTADSLEYIENYKISVSPDYTWLLIYNDQEVVLYDANDILAEKYMISGIQEVRWQPDSKGLFYSTGKELYHLSVPDGGSLFVDQCILNDCYFNLDDLYSVWLP